MKRCLLIAAVMMTVFFAGAYQSRAGFIDHFTTSADVGQFKTPHYGHSHILVIRVQVNNMAYDWAPWEEFFDNDSQGFTFRNYYRQQSLGRYDPIVTLTDPIEYADCPAVIKSKFPTCAINRGDVRALFPALQLIRELLFRIGAEQPWIIPSDFDQNGIDGQPDGWADGIILMSNTDFTGIAIPTSVLYNVDVTWEMCVDLINGLAPFLSDLGITPNPDDLCPSLVGKTPEEIMLDPLFGNLYLLEVPGLKIPSIAVASSHDSKTIPLHEFGHTLGFGDLYREHYATDPPETDHIPGLKYSLMGSYGSVGTPQLDGFSRMRIGWANPVQVKGTMTVLIPPVLNTGVVYWFQSGQDMFVVENRGPSGGDVDSLFTKNGLSVYHINLNREPDSGPLGFIFMLLHCLNCDDWSPFIMNEQADGLFQLQLEQYWTAGDSDLFHTGDEFLPGLNYEAPLSPTNLVFDSNAYSGFYTGFSITGIDSDNYAPNILATLSDGSTPLPDVSAKPSLENNEMNITCSASSGNASPIGAIILLLPLFFLLAWRKRRGLKA